MSLFSKIYSHFTVKLYWFIIIIIIIIIALAHLWLGEF